MTPLTLPSLQLRSDWTSQADSPGPHGPCLITPGTPTSPMKVAFSPTQRPQGDDWDNAYILHRNAYEASTQFTYFTNITFPTAQDIANCNAYEQDFQINDGGHIFNWGWQFLFGTGLRIWNRGGVEKWNNVRVPFTFTPEVPVPLVMTFAISGTSVVYLSAAINGISTPLNIAYPAVAEKESPYLNNAVQLDSKGHGASILLWVNECTVVGF
jgi:hypothetical protein